MSRKFNKVTQPQNTYKIFNNQDVIPEAWYITVKSKNIKKLQIKPIVIGEQKLILYRGKSGQVYALDAFCPHMGTSLEIGTVVGEHIRCYFHNWSFDGKGNCTNIPARPEHCSKLKTTGYAVKEAYGYIWVYPAAHTETPLLVPPDLEHEELVFSIDKPILAACHHHIRMINGLDAQHLKFVHNLDVDLELTLHQESGRINFILTGGIPDKTFAQKIAKFFFGQTYSYSMTYAQGSVASLTLLRNVYFLKPQWVWPRLYMMFAYCPGVDGMSCSYPIFITKKRSTFFGRLFARFLLFAVKRAYYRLRDEDQKVYDNIRFNTKNLLPIDQTVIQYIQYVENLTPSVWSKLSLKTDCEKVS